tara:strand:+ start:370 stop:765 length:396 start_codon:yes stop_codon:yes gene_type:complete
MIDAYVSLASVDLSDHVTRVTLNYESDAVEDTNMADTARQFLASGLTRWGLEVEFHQDYAASKVDATLFSVVGTSIAVEIRPDSDAVSATNPKFTGNAILTRYQPVAGSVGEMAMAPVTLVGVGALTRATS